MEQTHLFCGDWSPAFFSFSKLGGWITTCMVVTLPGMSYNGLLQSLSVLLFSKILPALIIFTSLTVLGPFSFSLGHCARTLSFKVAMLVAAGKVLGPISDPSFNRNLISNLNFDLNQSDSLPRASQIIQLCKFASLFLLLCVLWLEFSARNLAISER